MIETKSSTNLNFNDIGLTLNDETMAFFKCASLQTCSIDNSIISKRPNLFTYNVHSVLRYIKPFTYAPYRSINVDFDFAKRFLKQEKILMLDKILCWCNQNANPLIKNQFDQDVVLIHGHGYGIPKHKHGITDGGFGISYCIKLTDFVSVGPIFRIGEEFIPIFENNSCLSRFVLNTRDIDHEVIVDSQDPNLYMWFVKDGIELVDSIAHVWVERFVNAVR